MVQWDTHFLETLDLTQKLYLAAAADYLEIQSLIKLLVDFLVTLIKGKTPEEIRETFGLPNDLTPQDIEEINKDTVWVD